MEEKEQQITPRYANLQYWVMPRLEITITEYFYLDMVYQLSRNGWCYKSLENVANDMWISRNGVIKIRDRLTERGLLIKGANGRVKTSVKYNSVYFQNSKPYHSVTKDTTECTSDVPLSGTKNYIKNNKEKEPLNFEKKKTVDNSPKPDHRGRPSPALEKIRQAYRAGDMRLLKPLTNGG